MFSHLSVIMSTGGVSQHALRERGAVMKGGGGDVAKGVYTPIQTQPETATKAGGTHPTGMHSC